MFLSKCAVFNSEKSRFMNEKEPSGLLSKYGIKYPLCKILLLVDMFFQRY